MPNYCSTQQIAVATSESNLISAPIILLDQGDQMAAEVQSPVQTQEQTTRPIGSDADVPRARKGRSRTYTFSRIVDHVDVKTARKYQESHPLTIPTDTKLWAHILHEGDGAASSKTGRAAVTNCDVQVSGASETTATYTLRWGIGAT